jgi:hypothetical protein
MPPSAENTAPARLPNGNGGIATALCPVDRLPRRRRNQLCIAIITVGLLNFVAYTLTYAALGGDAHNGYCKLVAGPDGELLRTYVVRGHHVRALEGLETQVSRWAWIYSYLHSITVPLTSGAMIISMLVLARPHIMATMRDSWVGGRIFVTAFGAIVALLSAGATLLMAAQFAAQLRGG